MQVWRRGGGHLFILKSEDHVNALSRSADAGQHSGLEREWTPAPLWGLYQSGTVVCCKDDRVLLKPIKQV